VYFVGSDWRSASGGSDGLRLVGAMPGREKLSGKLWWKRIRKRLWERRSERRAEEREGQRLKERVPHRPERRGPLLQESRVEAAVKSSARSFRKPVLKQPLLQLRERNAEQVREQLPWWGVEIRSAQLRPEAAGS
jgi:hypothetical protein